MRPSGTATWAPADPPLSTARCPGTGGRIGPAPEDFRVTEIPAYEPSGDGAHCFVWFRKRGLTTMEAAKRIARALDRPPGQVGIAGLKDRHAVTEQWISVPEVDPSRVRSLTLEDITVLEARAHPHKLRTGHLRGNRFEIRLVEVGTDARPRAQAVLEALEAEGMLHQFGPQRFGRDGDNLKRGLGLLSGQTRGGGHRRQRRLLVSAVQSALFNDYLARRIQAGPLATPLPGEICQRGVRGGAFRCEAADLASVASRVGTGEVRLTGPLFGPKMRPAATGTPAELEARALEAAGLSRGVFDAWRRLAPGGRRPLTVPLEQVGLEAPAEGTLTLRFTLPAGAYATVLLREVTKTPFDALRG